ncbi:MAG TPA: xanthine dehydrogenase small subunit [Steroidobacteraceae bacterium]
MGTEPTEGGADQIRFLLDDEQVCASGFAPTMTLLEYLRDVAHRTGTKEGCAEGDCGACTVVLGSLAADGAHVEYRAINSCIRLLPTIDGHELITVESLADRDGTLHPVQQAMVDGHGSQCGFCTPGFVMSLFALYLASPAPTRSEVIRALAGNLCRCTGYRPIIDAGCAMSSYATPRHWSRAAALSTDRRQALLPLRRDRALRLPGFIAPRTTAELEAALAAEPGAVVLAGGTDVGLWVTKQLRDLPAIIYIGEVAELRRLQSDASGIYVGATVSLTDAWSAIVAAYPALGEVAERFGSPPVRNSGTLGGNIANGSPIGDAMPALMVLGAEIEVRSAGGVRRMPLDRFYLGYQRKDFKPGEYLHSLRVPPPRPGLRLASYKIAKRIDQDISAVCAAFAVEVEGGRIALARVAFGGMAAIPARARASEAALIGQPWNAEGIEPGIAALSNDFQPLSDLRASSAYRLEAAGNLLRRFYLEQTNSATPIRASTLAPVAV